MSAPRTGAGAARVPPSSRHPRGLAPAGAFADVPELEFVQARREDIDESDRRIVKMAA